MALYKPEGPGPFPAIVFHHHCGGLRSSSKIWQNMAILGWAKEAVARGYVALVLDSLGPRGVDSVCYPPVKGGVNFPRGVRDAYQAAERLRKLPYVDGDRIAFAGFSWGAMVGLLASGATWRNALQAGTHFRAIVAFYPGCYDIQPPGGTPYKSVQPDTDTPLLVLMGEADTETPPQECTARLEPLKSAGKPVDWHTYPGATHCWDCQDLDRLRKIDFRGAAVEYRYNRDVSKDSADRLFAFLRNVFEGKR
jgi:dienelactone hydrolase